jgi:hypothetical protein
MAVVWQHCCLSRRVHHAVADNRPNNPVFSLVSPRGAIIKTNVRFYYTTPWFHYGTIRPVTNVNTALFFKLM